MSAFAFDPGTFGPAFYISDPPGAGLGVTKAVGLAAGGVLLERFDETAIAQPPRDSMGNLADLIHRMSYPQSSDEMRALAGGYGRYSVGYFMDDTASPMVAKYGTPNLTHTSGTAPTFQRPGALGGLDKAIRLPPQGGSCILSGGDVFDVLVANDLIVWWVSYHALLPAVAQTFLAKDNTGTNRWTIVWDQAQNKMRSDVGDGTHNVTTLCNPPPVNLPYVGGMALARSTNKHVLGWRGFDGTSVISTLDDASTVVDINGGGNFTWGAAVGVDAWQDMDLSFLTVGVAPSAALGVPENFSAVLTNIVNGLLSRPAVVTAAAARGRSFVALSRHGYETQDITAGATLATRDCSVRALVKWDMLEQAAATDWNLTAITGDWNVEGSVGVSSAQTVTGDCVLEFVGVNDGNWYQLGLSANDTTTTFSGPQFSWMLRQDAGDRAVVFESGVQVYDDVAAWATGDIFRIERVGTTVKYYKNGSLRYTSGAASSGPLRIDTAFLGTNGSVQNIRLFQAGVRQPITWQNVINVTTAATGYIGALYMHGKDGGANEYISAGVELRVVNARDGTGEIGWLWETAGGVLKRQLGGQFIVPTSGYVLLTATRRWVSATKVVIRYYIGPTLILERETADGDIGGGASGTTTIGARYTGSLWADFLDGTLDELEVFDYELSARDIAAAWNQVSQGSKYTRMMGALLPPGTLWRVG